ncbi:unnamed protein product (macronuclear) [Paramecium tetraurelia]|uniref:Uncharacterized protein n=1 Tax=Paramecium tetraurelia TaxID=5888 RepID=A0E9S8_PARTE|nr:uncharacterized protein GSPATT00024776001 [Paramecium tetraurelia]CAK92045.1 unnamed protein product [Paramecium tetraurelia]|eukprot:XP_001459442.1 hypothetical protein (macronuclear) [Paramecium tetraurelia strain d4-2]
MILLLLFFLVKSEVETQGNIVLYRKDAQYTYIDLDTCPILYYKQPTYSSATLQLTWPQFCQSIQVADFPEPTTLDVIQQSSEAQKLSTDTRYEKYYCTALKELSDIGTDACCCKPENIDTELSTQGLTAVIVVPIVFFIGGLIMAKLNSHNSRTAWIHEFEQALSKA